MNISNFVDYIPHPDHVKRKLEKLARIEQLRREAGIPPPQEFRPVKPRLPMNRDYMSGEDVQKIEDRTAQRRAEIETTPSTFRQRFDELKKRAAVVLKEKGPKLSAEEKAELEKVTKMEYPASQAEWDKLQLAKKLHRLANEYA